MLEEFYRNREDKVYMCGILDLAEMEDSFREALKLKI